jgi:thioredoxin-like negative regulator of GroEL
VEFKDVNVQQDPDNIAGDYKVRGIPHTVVIKDGKVIRSQSGKMSEQQLKSFILN